jgi:hypothetical protein
MDGLKKSKKTQALYVIQFTSGDNKYRPELNDIDGNQWNDYGVYSSYKNATSFMKKAKKQFEYNQSMSEAHPEQVWPMIGVKELRIIKEIVTEKIITQQRINRKVKWLWGCNSNKEVSNENT